MRERVRSEPPTVHGLNVWAKQLSPYLLTDYGWFYWQYSKFYEKIVDMPKTAYVAYGKKRRRRAFRPLSHDKWSANAASPPQWVRTGPNNEAYVSACELLSAHHVIDHEADQCAMAYARAVSKGMSVDYGHYNRWNQVKPTVATRANLGVFLAELKDFSRMWDFIPKKHLLLKGVPATWQRLQNWWSSVRTDASVSKLPAYLNNQHLNYNFGWRPFVSDIKKCWKGLESFDRRLDRFISQADDDLRRRFRDSPRTVDETEYSTFQENSFWRSQLIWKFSEQHASAFDFTYSIPQYSEEEMVWRAIADTLGLKPSLSTFWELTPWTHVVDWFVNVGGFLESYETDWLQPWVQMHQGCYSRKLQGYFEWNVKSSDAYGGVVLPGIHVTFSQYIRKVGLPNFSAVTDPLDADKIRLGASLLFSLFKR